MNGLVWADISEWQEVIDWSAYARGHPMVCVRVHSGGRPDLFWEPNRDGARDAVEVRGWYHYFTRDRAADDQARDFLSTLGAVHPGEWVMLDAEQADFRLDGTDRDRAEQWLQLVAAALPGTPVVVYSEASSFTTGPLAGIDPRWPKIAASVLDQLSADAPESLRPNLGEVGWQFSWAHSFDGIPSPCDANTFPGSVDQFLNVIGTSTPGGFLMALSDEQQQQLYDAVMAMAATDPSSGSSMQRGVLARLDARSFQERKAGGWSGASMRKIAAKLGIK